MILIFVFLVTILCQSGCPSLKSGLIWRLTRAPHPLLMTEIWMGEKNSLRRHWRQFHARPRSVARNWLRVERENHKIDVTERSSRCLCSYTHIQKPSDCLFWTKKVYFKRKKIQWGSYNVKKKMSIKKWKQPSKVAYFSIIEKISRTALNCPYGQKLRIHGGNCFKEPSFIYSVERTTQAIDENGELFEAVYWPSGNVSSPSCHLNFTSRYDIL